jgi:hypothetical protein
VIRNKRPLEDDDFGPPPKAAKISGVSVLGAGAVFLVFLIILAVAPDRVGKVAGVVRNELDIPAIVNFGGPGGEAAFGAGTTQGGAVPVAMPGLIPFSPTKPQAFAGRVSQVATLGAEVGWGQLHIWINEGGGTLREISLAPLWYLQKAGCTDFETARVSGQAFQFDPSRARAELYAKTISVKGQTCRLRDDEGLALWVNPGR